MKSTMAATHGPGTQPGSTHLRLTVASAQVCLIAALAWLWLTGSSDPSSMTVDWALVWLTIATPLSLALSGWFGWRLHKRVGSKGSATIRGLALVAQWITLGLFALTLWIAPLAIFGAVVFGPIG